MAAFIHTNTVRPHAHTCPGARRGLRGQPGRSATTRARAKRLRLLPSIRPHTAVAQTTAPVCLRRLRATLEHTSGECQAPVRPRFTLAAPHADAASVASSVPRICRFKPNTVNMNFHPNKKTFSGGGLWRAVAGGIGRLCHCVAGAVCGPLPRSTGRASREPPVSALWLHMHVRWAPDTPCGP